MRSSCEASATNRRSRVLGRGALREGAPRSGRASRSAPARAGRPRSGRRRARPAGDRSPAAIASAVVRHLLERPQPEPDDPPARAAPSSQQHGGGDHDLDAQQPVQRVVHVVERERHDDRAAVRPSALIRDPVVARPRHGRPAVDGVTRPCPASRCGARQRDGLAGAGATASPSSAVELATRPAVGVADLGAPRPRSGAPASSRVVPPCDPLREQSDAARPVTARSELLVDRGRSGTSATTS